MGDLDQRMLVVVDAEIREALERLAAEDGRQLSQYVRECIIRPHLEQVGKKAAKR